MYSFLHVPVQSGSDAVLSDMKREYSVDDFCTVVDYLISQYVYRSCDAISMSLCDFTEFLVLP